MISPPINLGQAGLTLGVRLYFQAEGQAPVAQSVVGVTVVEIGLGDYYVAGLADPPAGSRAKAQVFEVATPALVMYEIPYGAVPGTSIVWRHEVVPGAPTQRIVQRDTYAILSLIVTAGLPAEIADGGTAASLTLYNAGTSAVFFSGRAVVISNVTQDGGGNGYGATFTYAIQAGDTATPGSYRGRVAIDYVGSMGIQTVPADDRFRVEIVPDYDAT
jgi:hypothetical protein